MTDDELAAAIDSRFRVHEERLTAEHAPDLPPADELLSAWDADDTLRRSQTERSRRIAAGTWSGDR